jgi:hypothetical protein
MNSSDTWILISRNIDFRMFAIPVVVKCPSLVTSNILKQTALITTVGQRSGITHNRSYWNVPEIFSSTEALGLKIDIIRMKPEYSRPFDGIWEFDPRFGFTSLANKSKILEAKNVP